jgi:hypothetical protein
MSGCARTSSVRPFVLFAVLVRPGKLVRLEFSLRKPNFEPRAFMIFPGTRPW